ncbi:MAG: hypothetical protein SGJ20_17005 [Planctomycetota bacterium]|nr:hypothetical protein [Planctomycetota bacterium]
MKTNTVRLIIVICPIILVIGCGGNEEVTRVAVQASDRQAQQNTELARLNREVAAGTKALVENDAKARGELIAAQKNLQSQQAEIGKNRDQLEVERQAMSQQRHTVSLWTPVLQGLGMVLIAALTISLCCFLLYGMRRNDDGGGQELGELLVMELTAKQPRWLPLPPTNAPALSSPSDSGSDGSTDLLPPALASSDPKP